MNSLRIKYFIIINIGNARLNSTGCLLECGAQLYMSGLETPSIVPTLRTQLNINMLFLLVILRILLF